MAYYKICPDCGATLDPGEKCDCRAEAAKNQEFFSRYLKVEPKAGQMVFVFDNKEVRHEEKSCH